MVGTSLILVLLNPIEGKIRDCLRKTYTSKNCLELVLTQAVYSFILRLDRHDCLSE